MHAKGLRFNSFGNSTLRTSLVLDGRQTQAKCPNLRHDLHVALCGGTSNVEGAKQKKNIFMEEIPSYMVRQRHLGTYTQGNRLTNYL